MFEEGDVVRLVGTNQKMTVENIADDLAWCVWFDLEKKLNRHAYKIFSLEETGDVERLGDYTDRIIEEERPTNIVRDLLKHIGEDPDREGLRETPSRVLRAWQERTSGYGIKPEDILKWFEDGAKGCDELVIVHQIPVVSVCEHHLADIVGHAHVGYIPNGRIVGLSKLARLVDIFARRLQVQEALTVQIAEALMQHLSPLGVGVLIRASHACMSTRGVRIHGSVTTTSAMRGVLLDKSVARKEFLDLCSMAERDRNV